MKPFRSESDNILPGITEERFLRAAREYARSAYPNPDRLGCPGRRQLEDLARRKRFPAPDEIDHIATCSPCFIEYESIRKKWKQKRAAVLGSAVAAAVAVAVVSGILLFNRGASVPTGPAKKPVEMAKETARTRVVDLRPYERIRGENQSTSSGSTNPIVLERENWDLIFQLPVGSEEGRYLFDFIDLNGVRRIESSAEARIKNFVTTAEVKLDLRRLSPGRFTLNVRRAGLEQPTPYPVEIR